MYADDDLLPLSALQHYAFCPRQCALIHVEQVWEENRLTAEGRVLHEHVDQTGTETRGDVVRATAIRLVSRELGVFGVADMLEFHKVDMSTDTSGRMVAVTLPRRAGYWKPFFVEYKRGKPKPNHADEVQLCAQALCLEEMLGVVIPSGALFYGETCRRADIVFDDALRTLTKETASAVHRMFSERALPTARESPACRACSLVELCRPGWASCHSAKGWLDRQMEESCL